MGFVAGLADVGGIVLIRCYGRLRWEGNVGRKKGGDRSREGGGSSIISAGNGGGAESERGWNGEVGHYLYNLVEMVEGDDGIEEHEEGFGHAEDIFKGSGSSWLEVANAVIAHIPNGTTRQWRENEAWDCGHAELGELLLEEGERVAFGSMSKTSLKNLSRV